MSTAVFQLSDIDCSNGFAVNSIHEADGSGFSVSWARDVNGDGFDDVIIGATPRAATASSGTAR